MTHAEQTMVEELKKYIAVLENNNAELTKVLDEVMEENKKMIELLDGAISGA